MAKLIYSTITSLDGYIEDATGSFQWAAPDPEVMKFLNELERPVGTYLYGRRLYETMIYWETAHEQPDHGPEDLEWTEIWQAADKIVYSTTLDEVSTKRTRLEREFDPEAIRRLKQESDRDISIGGPALAEHALRAGLVDDFSVYLNPVIVGGGKPALPDGVRLDLELLEERHFASGVVFLRYRVG